MASNLSLTMMQILNISATEEPIVPAMAFNAYWGASAEYKFVMTLRTFVPPVVTVTGIMGNLLAFYVLQRHKLSSASVNHYLSVILIVNCLNLCLGCGQEWLSHITGRGRLAGYNDWTCKLYQFTFNVFTYSPYWLLVVLLLDRIVCVCYCHHTRSICTAFTAKIFTVFIYVGLISVSVHAMWTFEVGAQGCNIDPRQQDMYTIVWPWIAAVLYSYLPITIIIILITALLVQFNSKKQKQKHYISLVIILAIVFVMLSLPSLILNVIEYSRPSWLRSYQSYVRLYAVAELFQTLGSVNSAITHVICFCCCARMRKEFKRISTKRRIVSEEARPMIPITRVPTPIENSMCTKL